MAVCFRDRHALWTSGAGLPGPVDQSMLPVFLWALANFALYFLLRPLGIRLAGRHEIPLAQVLTIALSALCVFAGTVVSVYTGSRALCALAPLLLALAARLALARRPEPACGIPETAHRFVLAGVGTLALATVCWGLRVPLFQYDGLLYHLPAAALAWQSQSLFVISAHPQIGSNPILAELPKIWGFSFSGDDSLAGLQQVVYLTGVSLLAYNSALELGTRRTFAAMAAFAVFFVPKAFEQGVSPNVDLIAGFWGALAALLIGRKNISLAGVALLIFAQLKYTTFLPAFAGAIILAVMLSNRRKKMIAAMWLLLFLSAGGMSEWRNLYRYGNPTHPYQLRVSADFPRAIRALAPGFFVLRGQEESGKWDGYYLNRIERAAGASDTFAPLRHWFAYGDLVRVPYDEFGGRWGAVWFLLAVPAMFTFLLFRFRKLPRKSLPSARIAGPAAAMLFYLLIPKSWEPRLGLLLLPFGFACMAWAFSLLSRARARIELKAALMVFGAALLACSNQVRLSHPNSELARKSFLRSTSPGAAEVLPFTTRDPDSAKIQELAASIDSLSPSSLRIVFTQGERHGYGMAGTLLYPYFSRRWSEREITIVQSAASAELFSGSPSALLLQEGAVIGPEKLGQRGYRLILKNEKGAVYARR